MTDDQTPKPDAADVNQVLRDRIRDDRGTRIRAALLGLNPKPADDPEQ